MPHARQPLSGLHIKDATIFLSADHRQEQRATAGALSARCQGKATWATTLLGERVGPQTARKVHERRDATGLGAPAPVLELTQELLLGRAGAVP